MHNTNRSVRKCINYGEEDMLGSLNQLLLQIPLGNHLACKGYLTACTGLVYGPGLDVSSFRGSIITTGTMLATSVRTRDTA